MIALGAYTVDDALLAHGEFSLARCRDPDRHRVLVRAPRAERPTPACLRQLDHELALADAIDPAWGVRPLKLDLRDGRTVLVLADPGGDPLSRQLGAPMDVARFLEIAVGLATTLGKLHDQGLVHKRIEPAHILIGCADGAVRLTGFGIMARLTREPLAPESLELLADSLPYMAPEQTGRMRRAIDARSDLYALGVTFYEMLTGMRPFSASDPIGWVHCHVAQVPVPPHQRVASVPAQLSAIVMKLLAKTAEDRYQTAGGVAADLRRCLDLWSASGGRIETFGLGAEDLPGRLTVGKTLYGREREARTLGAALARVLDGGAPELVLVSGYSGIGKSSLVDQLRRSADAERAIFLAGKFDQFGRVTPYAPFAQAFQAVVRELLGRNDAEVAAWRDTMREALGAYGQLIVDLIPELAFVIGDQPAVPAQSPAEARHRFHRVFQQFVGAIARPGQPLILFLDDLQWSDAGSLELLAYLLGDPATRRLLVIGAYRSNEVTPSHPLMLTLDAVRKTGTQIDDLVLATLTDSQLGQLVGDTLACSPAHALPLARLLQEKTGGNPFFAIQFLTTLHEERLLAFDKATASWRWDLRQIRAVRFTDNVVDLMVGKLQRLPDDSLAALRWLACLGNSARLSMLAITLQRTESETRDDLAEAFRAGFLNQDGERVSFIHDRVLEAAYSLIPDDERAAAHLQVGRLLAAQLSDSALDEAVFDLVNQFNRGLTLLVDAGERARVCGLNTMAGRKARAAAAYASALEFLHHAASLLPDDAWQARYETTFALYLDLLECAYFAGNFEEADQLYKLVLERAGSTPDAIRVRRIRLKLCQVTGRNDEAVSIALEALALAGLKCPETDAEAGAAVAAAHRTVQDMLRGKRIADLIDAPTATDPAVRELIGLMADAAPPFYFVRPALFPFINLTSLRMSLEHGNIPESVGPYSSYGALLAGVLADDYAGAFEFSELALRMSDEFGNAKQRGQLLFRHGIFINGWRRPIATSLPILDQAFAACMEAGDLVFAGFTAGMTMATAFEIGDRLERAREMIEKYRAFIAQDRASYIMKYWLPACEDLINAMEGVSDRIPDHHVANFLKVDHRSAAGKFHVWRQVVAFTYERFDEALAAGTDAANSARSFVGMPSQAVHHFYLALTLTALWADADDARRREFTDALATHRRKLAVWADNCPANYASPHALVEAETARVEGRLTDAIKFYETAIGAARDHGAAAYEGIASELAARFYRDQGARTGADAHLRNARDAYQRWGALGKIRLLDRLQPQLAATERAPADGGALGARSDIDLLAVVKASQAVSGEIVLAKLVESLLTVVLQCAGAERGLLILPRDGAYRIAAEATTDGDRIAVALRASAPDADDLPLALLHYAARTREQILLDDAGSPNPFSADAYIVARRPKSVFCLPVIKQTKVVALLYLENNLATGAFTQDHIAVLDLLGAQAAISLENATLYAEMEQRVEERTHDLQLAKDVAEAANSSKSSFLAVMSHEIRTPMNGILTMAQMLRESRLDDDQQGMADIVLDSAGSLLTVINDILDFSKIEAGKLDIEAVETAVGDVVEGVAALLAAKAAEQGLMLLVDVDPALPARVLVDATRLRQILINLAGNAIKFTEHGHVLIRVGVAQAQGAAARLRFEVADSGIGLSADQQAKLFQPFVQADSSITRRFGGSGLGLSICRRLVELMGGEIGVESAPGSGSTFWFQLTVPVARPAEIAPELADLDVAILTHQKLLGDVIARQLRAAGAATRVLDQPSALGAARAHVVLVDQTLAATVPADDLPMLVLARSKDAAPAAGVERIEVPWRRHSLVARIAIATGRRKRAARDGEAAVNRPQWLAPDRAAADGAGATLLVAEDNPVNRAVIGKLLENLGYVATFATDGEHAWRLLGDGRFGLVITDCHMPGLDGYGLARRLRQAEQDGTRAGRMPLLALTADVRPEIEALCRDAGMDGVLAKPLDRAAIDAAIASWLPAAAELRQRVEDESDAPAPSPSPAAAAASAIDLAMLEATFGAARARTMLELFVTSIRPYLDRLDGALAAGAVEDAFQAAHAAKGSALLVGAKPLAAACETIESALRGGDLPRARGHAPDIKPLFAAVQSEVEALAR